MQTIRIYLRSVSFLVLSACYVQHQKASEVMAPELELPPTLQKLANPQLSQSLLDEVLAKDSRGRLAVAVIDNGVDYTHPQLVGQIRFELDGSQVVAAGRDILGSDSFASPNLINSEYFAFGAEAVQDGGIRGPVEDPLKLLSQYNRDFMDRLTVAIGKSRSLRRTLYVTRINFESLSVFAVHRWMANEVFRIEKFKKASKEGKLLPHEAKSLNAEQRERLGKEGIRLVYSLPWMMNSSGEASLASIPDAPVFLAGLQKADEFFKVVEAVWKEFTQTTEYLKDYESFVQYQAARQAKPEELRMEDFSKSQMTALAQAWFEVEFNHPNADRTDGFVETFCELVTDAEFDELRSAETPADRKDAIVRAYLTRADEFVEKMDGFVSSDSRFTSDQKAQAKRNRALYGNYQKYGAKYLEIMGTRLLTCDRYANLRQNYEPAALKREKLVSHPYWGRGNADESHGTHVAGVIAAQSPRIDVFPVRVVTSTTEPLKRTDVLLKAELKQQFSSWLKNSVIQRGVRSGLARSLGMSGDLVESNLESDVAKIEAAFSDYVDKNFSSFRLDVYFIREVMDALRVVGQNRIKLANISLGTSFEKAIAQLNPNDLEKERDSMLKFFMYELFKSEVARVATEHAPHTLFVIAAGNDGAWVDGRSRSALPCDLSATYFERFVGPNEASQIQAQRLRNVVCVGSVGPNQELSSFSNIPLTQVPFVFSYGEQIYSHLKTTDCTGAEQEKAILSGESPSYPSLVEYKEDVGLIPDEKGLDYLKQIGIIVPPQLKGLERDRWLRDEFARIRKISTGLWSELRNLTLYQRCLDDNAPAARLSGTSMATPAVAGFLARYVLEKMDQLGVDENQAYDMAEFAPMRLLEEASARQPTFGGSSLLSRVAMISDIQQILSEPMGQWPRVIGHVEKAPFQFSNWRRLSSEAGVPSEPGNYLKY